MIAPAPAYLEVAPDRDSYVTQPMIQHMIRREGFVRGWRVKQTWRTVQRHNGKTVRAIEPIAGLCNSPEALAEFCREAAEITGCQRPGTYHAPVYKAIRFPRVPWSINAFFAPYFAGGWQAALQRGCFAGPHHVYDIQSAYLSALYLGLPDPATYRWSRRIEQDGLFVVTHIPRADLPYPYCERERVAATGDEIARYGLEVTAVHGGVVWSRLWKGTRELFALIRSLSFWKFAARAYWGAWAMSEPVQQVGGRSGTLTDLRSIYANYPWAHLVVGRIRMRLWREVRRGDVLHVFTDSILTRGRRITSDTVGGWKLAREYPQGVYIRAPGQYGAMLSEFLDKHAGLTSDYRPREDAA